MYKAAFLDRDGVINIDTGYIKSWKEFSFIPGSIDAMRQLQENNYNIFIITNQSGIARGRISIDEYNILEEKIEKFLDNLSIKVVKTYFCPHHPDGKLEAYRKVCSCRKPEPGMILKAALDYNIDIKNSILVGDKISDIECSENSGIKVSYLIRSKYNKTHNTIKYDDLKSCVDYHLNNYVR